MSAVLYRAGDCFLADNDNGFGSRDTATGAVACVSESGRIIQWLPITGGSTNMEDNFNDVWAAVGSQLPFPNTCDCATLQDNGAGIKLEHHGSGRRHTSAVTPDDLLANRRPAPHDDEDGGQLDGGSGLGRRLYDHDLEPQRWRRCPRLDLRHPSRGLRLRLGIHHGPDGK